ncbi:MAG: M24 family metallopeptidase [Rhodospirillales bacterium]|jgi:Xaa-Pro aminopeptidase|nr:M24 family metallopeptidase [Rhodospirillales bacterium]
MDEAKERSPVQISTAELERRWTAVRRQMEDRGIDVLVMQNTNQWLGGYVKWFTDIPAANGYPMTVMFERDAEMTVINCGPHMSEQSRLTDLSARDWSMRGVANRWTAPFFPSLYYSATYDAQLIAKYLSKRGKMTLGWVGPAHIHGVFQDYLRNNLANVTFVDATDMVDCIKAIKSPEEIELIRIAAAVQDKGFEAVLNNLKPGKRDNEVMAAAQYCLELNGSEEQLIMVGSTPMGQPASMYKRHFMHRVIQKGDQFTVMLEANGPGGFYTELARNCVLGKASSEQQEAFAIAKEAQAETLKLLKPGAVPGDIVAAHNEFLRRHGYPEERRLFAHGQGYDLVERPSIREDEPMHIQANMNITVHPIVATKNVFTWVCDNYMITETGVSECLHRTEKKIFEL